MSWFTDRNEFYSADLLAAPVQDLTKRSRSATQVTSENEKGDVVMKEMEEEDEEDVEEEYLKAEKKMPRRAAAK